jgi:hypothetical protein
MNFTAGREHARSSLTVAVAAQRAFLEGTLWSPSACYPWFGTTLMMFMLQRCIRVHVDDWWSPALMHFIVSATNG